ncbi:MAG: hypothetical protein WA108_14170 [Thiobacillus sp.]|jgi:hypothetical protein
MKTSNSLEEYFSALERLIAGRPDIVRKGMRITNDAVSLEAGRGKGSIKKSRAMYSDLISAIEKAAAEQAKPQNEQKAKVARAKELTEQYRRELEAALAREVSLLRELFETKKQLARLSGAKVIPIRGKRENDINGKP